VEAELSCADDGYMRIVSAKFIEAWRGRLLNVHPSLLLRLAG